MGSVWIRKRVANDGSKRYRVEYRIGGRESKQRYGGTFRRKEDANTRKGWIAGELAARRTPAVSSLLEPALAPTLGEAAASWRQSRVDVVEDTANMHRSAFVRIFGVAPELRSRR